MRYKLFFTPSCPKCPGIKDFMKAAGMEGEEIDATTPEGIEQAKRFNVNSVPTVLFLEGDEVKSEAHDIGEIKKVIENKKLV